MDDEADVPALARAGNPRSTRSRKGCLTCRLRHVKCDENKLTCLNCKKLKLDCRWSAMSRREAEQELGVRQRFLEADKGSSASFAGSQAYPGPEPSIISRPHARTHSIPQGQVPSEERFPNPTREEVEHHAKLFFEYVYPVRCNAFVNEEEFGRALREGKVGETLGLVVCAVSARYARQHSTSTPISTTTSSIASQVQHPTDLNTNPDGTPQAAHWASKAKQLVLGDIDTYLTSKLVCLLLLYQHEMNSGRWGSGWMILALASRMAYGLGLDRDDDRAEVSKTSLSSSSKSLESLKGDWVKRETKRRLMWACWAADSLAADGSEIYSTVTRDSLGIQTPCSEENYDSGGASQVLTRRIYEVESGHGTAHSGAIGASGTEGGYDQGGAMNHLVRILAVRSDVLRYSKQSHSLDRTPWTPGSTFHLLESRIKAWEVELPDHLRFTRENIVKTKQTAELDQLVTLHLTADSCACMLTRWVIPDSPWKTKETGHWDSAEDAFASVWVKDTLEKCLFRSTRMIERVALVANIWPESILLDHWTIVMVTEAVRVWLILTKGTRNGSWFKNMKGTLQVAFGYLARMTVYYAAARSSLEILRDLLHKHGIIVLADAIQPRESIDHGPDANSAVQTSVERVSISAREPLPNSSNYVLDRVVRKFDSLTLGGGKASQGKLAEPSRLHIPEAPAKRAASDPDPTRHSPALDPDLWEMNMEAFLEVDDTTIETSSERSARTARA